MAKQDYLRQTANVAALVTTLAVNWLGDAFKINGQTTASVSDQFPTLITPAGYTFSIWGPIYLGLSAFAIYQALPSQRENPHARRIGYLFLLNCAANCAWIFLWHYVALALSLAAISLMLLTLIAIHQRLRNSDEPITTADRWCIFVPFSVYFGWTTVATIVNATVVLTSRNWSGWGITPETWATGLLLVAAALGVAISTRAKDPAYGLVVTWASAGIAVGQADAPMVARAAWLVAGGVAVVVGAVALWRSRGGSGGLTALRS